MLLPQQKFYINIILMKQYLIILYESVTSRIVVILTKTPFKYNTQFCNDLGRRKILAEPVPC